jgi:hypothetical protein
MSGTWCMLNSSGQPWDRNTTPKKVFLVHTSSILYGALVGASSLRALSCLWSADSSLNSVRLSVPPWLRLLLLMRSETTYLQSSEPPHKQNANQTLQIICLHFKSLLQKLDLLFSKVHEHYYNMSTLHDVSFH